MNLRRSEQRLDVVCFFFFFLFSDLYLVWTTTGGGRQTGDLSWD